MTLPLDCGVKFNMGSLWATTIYTIMNTIELKESDMRRMAALNAKNEWGLYPEQMLRLIQNHQKAKEAGNAYKCALIEYRLTDINYHSEVQMLAAGRYSELREEIKQW